MQTPEVDRSVFQNLLSQLDVSCPPELGPGEVGLSDELRVGQRLHHPRAVGPATRLMFLGIPGVWTPDD